MSIKERITEHVKAHPGIWTSDLITDLDLPVEDVLQAVEELSREGIIEGKAPKCRDIFVPQEHSERHNE